jgi:protein-disulfide isomerase
MGSILTFRRALAACAFALVIVAGVPTITTGQEPSTPDAAATVGPASATYVLTVYTDFACAPCGHLATVLEALVASAPQRVRIVFKHAPSDESPGRAAHLAAAAAAQQGRFWEMHSVLFSNQDRLSAADVLGMAQQLGLDMNRFQAALTSPEVAAAVNADVAEATRLGAIARPHLLINGAPFAGPPTLENLTRATGGR